MFTDGKFAPGNLQEMPGKKMFWCGFWISKHVATSSQICNFL